MSATHPHMVWSVSTAFSTAFFAHMLINFSFQQVSQQLFTHVDQFFFSTGFSTAFNFSFQQVSQQLCRRVGQFLLSCCPSQAPGFLLESFFFPVL